MEGDEWMCHPEDNEYMPVDITWGIMPRLVCTCPYLDCKILFFYHVTLTVLFCSPGATTSLIRAVEFFGKDFQ